MSAILSINSMVLLKNNIGGDIGYNVKILSDMIEKNLAQRTMSKNDIGILTTEKKSGVLTDACTVIDEFFCGDE